MIFILKNLKFFKDVATLMTGSVVAQMIAAVAYPFLSRLYSPTEMGFFAFFSGICAMLVILSTGRYELAIILPEFDKEADNIAALSIFFAGISCILSLFIIFAFYPYIACLSKDTQLSSWLYYIPALALLMSFSQIIDYIGTRSRAYQKLAIKSVLQQFIYVSFAILLGIWTFTNNGLIVGRILSFVCIAIIAFWMFFDKIQMVVKNISVKLMLENFFRYKQFLLCNVPYSFLGTFSKEFVIFIFVAFGYPENAGLFALARNVLFVPIYFLSSTLGQAFYKEAAAITGTPKLEQLVLQLINSIVIFGVPTVIFCVIWVHEIFSFCFGDAWWSAGTYAGIFMPAAFLFLFTSWPERLYEVAQKQHISLKIQIIFDFLIIFSLWAFLKLNFSILNCIWLYTILNCIYQVTYLINIFKVSNFDLYKLLDSGIKALILIFFSIISLYLPCRIFTSVLAQFIGSASLLSGYYLFVIYLNMRPIAYSNLRFLLID